MTMSSKQPPSKSLIVAMRAAGDVSLQAGYGPQFVRGSNAEQRKGLICVEQRRGPLRSLERKINVPYYRLGTPACLDSWLFCIPRRRLLHSHPDCSGCDFLYLSLYTWPLIQHRTQEGPAGCAGPSCVKYLTGERRCGSVAQPWEAAYFQAPPVFLLPTWAAFGRARVQELHPCFPRNSASSSF